ncbi:MAG: DUF433 domain-containing protein [Chloroflexi bacterium]|nr:DUF433 domain-containing protein [Chloroflexota bacterium]
MRISQSAAPDRNPQSAIRQVVVAEVEVAPRIVVDDAIHPGRPIIKGSRIPVSLVLGSLSAGLSPSEVARQYEVAEEDIRAALDYARAVAEQETVPIAVE